MKCPSPTYSPTWSHKATDVGEEHRVAGAQMLAGDRDADIELLGRDARELDPLACVRVLDQSRGVGAGAARPIGSADELLGHLDRLPAHRDMHHLVGRGDQIRAAQERLRRAQLKLVAVAVSAAGCSTLATHSPQVLGL